LETERDVEVTFEAGFTMYTIDPSDYVDDEADNYNLEMLKEIRPHPPSLLKE